MRARILLMEGNPEVARAVTTILELNHFQVVQAEDDREAVERLEDDTFDLLVIDINLSDRRSGLAFLQHLRNSAPHLMPRSVVISSNPPESVRQELHSIGVCEVVPKPIHMDEILAAVEECLDLTSSSVH